MSSLFLQERRIKVITRCFWCMTIITCLLCVNIEYKNIEAQQNKQMIVDALIIGTRQNGFLINKETFLFRKDNETRLSIVHFGEEGASIMFTPKGGDNSNYASNLIETDGLTIKKDGEVKVFIGMPGDKSTIAVESVGILEDGKPVKFLN